MEEIQISNKICQTYPAKVSRIRALAAAGRIGARPTSSVYVVQSEIIIIYNAIIIVLFHKTQKQEREQQSGAGAMPGEAHARYYDSK
jgi:hypothetical protein